MLETIQKIRRAVSFAKSAAAIAKDGKTVGLLSDFAQSLAQNELNAASSVLIDLLSQPETRAAFMPRAGDVSDPESIAAALANAGVTFERENLPTRDALHVDGAFHAAKMARHLRIYAKLLSADPTIEKPDLLIVALYFAASLCTSLYWSFSPAVHAKVKQIAAQDDRKEQEPSARDAYSWLLAEKHRKAKEQAELGGLSNGSDWSPLFFRGFEFAAEILRQGLERAVSAPEKSDSESARGERPADV